MSIRRDDFTTYPGDRHTRLTPAQRERKLDAARGKMFEAFLLLKEVCGDFDANGYRLTEAERSEWRAAVDLISPLERTVGPNA